MGVGAVKLRGGQNRVPLEEKLPNSKKQLRRKFVNYVNLPDFGKACVCKFYRP